MSVDWYDEHDPATPVLLLAPPGCGKTEGIAGYSHHLARIRHVAPPAQILALSYSRKAAASLRGRLEKYFGGAVGRYADVRTFHSWAHRVVLAHGARAGIDLPGTAPSRSRVEQLLHNACGGDYDAKATVSRALRDVKAAGHPEEEIRERLASTDRRAGQYHRRLRSEGMYDYDDLIGWARRTLALDGVADAYQPRFPVVIVDEVQDLTLAMFDLAVAFSPRTSVFAGDRQQGIYRFAGAEPDAVLRAIRQRDPREVQLSTSYRSSPAVLSVVSKLGATLGAPALVAAEPTRWPGGGSFEVVAHDSPEDEARWVADEARRLLALPHVDNVGILTRGGRRRQFVDDELESTHPTVEKWDDPCHSPEAVQLLRRHVGSVDAAATSPVDTLRTLCLAEVADDDFDLISAVSDALAVLTASSTGELAEQISALRVPSSDTAPVGPGVHLLNGHLGKGQEFDAVIVVGLEEYTLPGYSAIKDAERGKDQEMRDEQAVLRVMASRARHHLAFSRSRRLPRISDGRRTARDPSRFLDLL